MGRGILIVTCTKASLFSSGPFPCLPGIARLTIRWSHFPILLLLLFLPMELVCAVLQGACQRGL